jgi:hypothetical protein
MALTFVGASSQRLSGNAPFTAAPFTFSAWIQLSSTAANETFFNINNNGGTSTALFQVYFTTTNKRLAVLTRNGAGIGQTFSAVNSITATDTWYHIAGVFAGADSRTAYVNGTAGTTETTSVTPSAAGLVTMSLGVERYNGAYAAYLDGKMAEAAVWDVALSADEITALADGLSPQLVRPASIVSYWPLMGRVSPEPDLFPGVNPLTLTNTPTQSAHPPMRYTSKVQAWSYVAAAPPSIVGPLVHSRLVGRSPLIGGRLAA